MKCHHLKTLLPRAARGFSLIELMVSVAIIGILAAIAVPSYTRYVIKTNRSAAQTYMFQLANKEEQYLLDARQYTSTKSDLMSDPAEVSRNYTVAISNVTANTYTITATPTGNQLSKDTECGTLTLTQAGAKGISGTGTVSSCW